MTPHTLDIVIRRGDTKEVFFRVRERTWHQGLKQWVAGDYRNLTGWSVLAQVRSSHDSEEVAAQFAATLYNQTTTPGGVLLKLTPTQTAALVLPTACGVWDCQMTNPSGDVYTYLEGAVALRKDVSRV